MTKTVLKVIYEKSNYLPIKLGAYRWKKQRAFMLAAFGRGLTFKW